MKAEHRHELKTNDLSKALLTTGDYVKEYGGRVALALAVVIMVVVFVNTRVKRGRENQARLKSNLAYVQAAIDQLEVARFDPTGVPTAPPARYDDLRVDLETILDDASDKQVLAQALIAKGDLNWALANYPRFPPNSPATTQPKYKLEKDRRNTSRTPPKRTSRCSTATRSRPWRRSSPASASPPSPSNPANGSRPGRITTN